MYTYVCVYIYIYIYIHVYEKGGGVRVIGERRAGGSECAGPIRVYL